MDHCVDLYGSKSVTQISLRFSPIKMPPTHGSSSTIPKALRSSIRFSPLKTD